MHDQFEEQYKFAQGAIDELAERIRVFGQTPLSTMKEYLDNSDIKEAGTDLSALEMVSEILRDYHTLLEHMLKVVEVAIEHGDNGTEDMIKGFIKTTEKNHWMMTSFASKG